MDVVDITATEAQTLLARDEGHFVDFKSAAINPAKLSKTIAAFANADGGEVFIGIEDKKCAGERWRGFASVEDANALIEVFNSKFPVGTAFNYEFLQAPGLSGLVLHCEIYKNSKVWTDTQNTVYVRRGAQSLKEVDRETVKRLEYAKGVSSFEDEKLPADINFLIDSSILGSFVSEIVPSAEPDVWLKKQRLIVDGNVSVAGVVLFAEEPQVLLPKAAIKIYRYKTSEIATRESLEGNPETVEGCAYEQIRASVARVVEIVEEIPVIKDAGFEKISYPDNALHEIITNAVIHRDYSASDDVHVIIFNNRIEITSPGRLPGHVTTSNILTERFARNQKIVRLLNKFPDPPNKDVGEGLNTAFEAMRGLNLKDPEIAETEGKVVVTLRHEKLAQPETVIVDYLHKNDEINNSKAREITHIGSEAKITKIFSKLKKNGIIMRTAAKSRVKAAYTRGPKFPSE